MKDRIGLGSERAAKEKEKKLLLQIKQHEDVAKQDYHIRMKERFTNKQMALDVHQSRILCEQLDKARVSIKEPFQIDERAILTIF
jgi:hypothetical protein